MKFPILLTMSEFIPACHQQKMVDLRDYSYFNRFIYLYMEKMREGRFRWFGYVQRRGGTGKNSTQFQSRMAVTQRKTKEEMERGGGR